MNLNNLTTLENRISYVTLIAYAFVYSHAIFENGFPRMVEHSIKGDIPSIIALGIFFFGPAVAYFPDRINKYYVKLSNYKIIKQIKARTLLD